jgi:ACT domain
VSYLLRLLVPDRPGALGAVATAFGEVGADIVSLDVVERGHGIAVDDMVVHLPRGRLPDSLITAAQAVEGVEVESLRPFAGPLDTHRELDLLEALARVSEGGSVELLAEELPHVFNSGWAAVLESAEGSVRTVAASEAAPSFEGVHVPWLPLKKPRLLPSDEKWLPARWREMAIEMMAAPFGGQGCALVVGRSGGPAFRRSELLRLMHMSGLAATVSSLPPD